jgi:uncharacterized membrane protein YtjA (UPF0391 family)
MIRAGELPRTDRFRPSVEHRYYKGDGMFSTGLAFLIAALVAATFGFGGIDTSLAGPARGLALLLFFGFGICVVLPAVQEARELEDRRNSKRRLEAGGDAEPAVL